jgi:ABC-type transporter Mla subunit MlaD
VAVAAEGLRERYDRFDSWRRQLVAELGILPETLRQLREGVENFQRVSQRLSDATESLEQINQLQAGAIRALRDQIANAPGGAAVSGALEEINHALTNLARLNPFWPR